jgi:hypothetical protein
MTYTDNRREKKNQAQLINVCKLRSHGCKIGKLKAGALNILFRGEGSGGRGRVKAM